jgi:hypothetical protein
VTIDADRAWRGLTSRGHAPLFASRRAPLAPGAVVTPWGKGVLDGARGEQSMGQPIPLTTTPMESAYRVEDFPQIDPARASSSRAWLGRRAQRFHDGPVLVRQIRWIILARLVFLTLLRTPPLMGYALTLQEVYCFAKFYVRIASKYTSP